MKRIQLIEWGIIAIGLIFGYKFMEGMISVIIQFITAIMLDGMEVMTVVPSLVITIIYLALLIGAIRYSRNIATYLNGPENATDTVPLKIGKQALLQVILVSICAFTILSNIATILYNIYASFKSEVNPGYDANDNIFLSRRSPAIGLIIPVLQVVTAIVVIVISKKIVASVFPKNEPDELVLDTKPEN